MPGNKINSQILRGLAEDLVRKLAEKATTSQQRYPAVGFSLTTPSLDREQTLPSVDQRQTEHR